MEIYQKEIQIAPEGLSTGDLFRALQDAAGEQSSLVHQGADDLAAKGLMWVVIRYQLSIARWPQGGERVALQTWPGSTRHGMMPRYYRVTDAGGAACIQGCGVWAVVDRVSRKMVSPEEHGVVLETLVTGWESPMPRPVRKQETDRSRAFTVPAEYLDSNGHMNNTRYYDLAEQCIGRSARDHGLRTVSTEHLTEALCGETMQLHWGQSGERFYIAGQEGDTTVFRMILEYGE